MAKIRILDENVLDGASITITNGTAHATSPITRLFDRSPSRLFVCVPTAVPVTFTLAAFPTARMVDTFFIPALHGGLVGRTVTFEYLTGGVWTEFDSQTITDTTQIVFEKDVAVSADQVRIVFSGGGLATFSLTEIVIGESYEISRLPSRPSGDLEMIHNVEHLRTPYGYDRYIVHGPSRKQRSYSFPNVPAADADEVLAIYAALGGARPFLLRDHLGEWIFGNLDGKPKVREILAGRYSMELDLVEVL